MCAADLGKLSWLCLSGCLCHPVNRICSVCLSSKRSCSESLSPFPTQSARSLVETRVSDFPCVMCTQILIIRCFSSSSDLDHEYELCEKHVGMLSVIRGINQLFKLHSIKHHMQLMLLLFKTRYESGGPSIICCMLLLMYNKQQSLLLQMSHNAVL